MYSAQSGGFRTPASQFSNVRIGMWYRLENSALLIPRIARISFVVILHPPVSGILPRPTGFRNAGSNLRQEQIDVHGSVLYN